MSAPTMNDAPTFQPEQATVAVPEQTAPKRTRKANPTAPPPKTPQPAAPASRKAARVRNPTLCYLLIEARADGKPGKVFGSYQTRGRAVRALEVLRDAGVCDPRSVAVFRAVKVLPQ